jgi:probable F420-dependent oxidoreductase
MEGIMTIRFNLFVPTIGPLAAADSLMAVARRAEELGYPGIWTGDHVVLPRDADYSRYLYGKFPVPTAIDTPYYEPVASIAFLAGATKTIQLGIGVLVVPYRNAVLLGKQLATIDNLAGGRVVLGVGTGWMAEEFDALGLPRSVYEERGAVTDESLDVFRALWSDGPSSFKGRYYDFEELGAWPKPATPGGIPIWVGGNSAPAFRRIVRHGSGWLALGLTIDQFREKSTLLDRMLEEAGRAPGEVARGTTMGVLQIAAGASPRLEPQTSLLVGDSASLAAQLNRLAEAGVNEMMISFAVASTDEMLRQMEDFRHVIDRL